MIRTSASGTIEGGSSNNAHGPRWPCTVATDLSRSAGGTDGSTVVGKNKDGD